MVFTGLNRQADYALLSATPSGDVQCKYFFLTVVNVSLTPEVTLVFLVLLPALETFLLLTT